MALVSTFTMEVGKGLPPQVFWNRHQLRTIGPDQSRLDAPAFEDVLQHRGVDRHLMIEEVKNQCKIIKSFDEITEPCMKVAVYEREGMTEESIRYWRERFKDRCTVVTSGFAWVDFVPFTTNKAKGIRKYQELLGIGPDECMAFGDEYNDIEMMKSVKYSFAMKHAKPGVKAAAFYETEKVEPVLRRLIAAGGDIKEVL